MLSCSMPVYVQVLVKVCLPTLGAVKLFHDNAFLLAMCTSDASS